MSMFRHPKTQAERRASADPEIRDLVRAKRRPKNLPTVYCDLEVGKGKRNNGQKPRKPRKP